MHFSRANETFLTKCFDILLPFLLFDLVYCNELNHYIIPVISIYKRKDPRVRRKDQAFSTCGRKKITAYLFVNTINPRGF
jgi:hypothetical protein